MAFPAQDGAASDAEPTRAPASPHAPAGGLPLSRLDRAGQGCPSRAWTINGDFLGLNATGVARSGIEITRAIDDLMAEGHPLAEGLAVRLATPRLPSGLKPFQSIETVLLPELRPRLPQVWVQMQLPGIVSGGLLSLCNLAPVRVRRHIACIHDLQTFTVPDSYGFAFRAAHRLILPRLGRNAETITTVSNVSRSQIVALGLAPADKVMVVPNGADHATRWDPGQGRRDWRRPRPFVLGIGRNEQHKNTRLFARLAGPLGHLGLDLVLVGAFDPALVACGAGPGASNLHVTGRIGDDDLAAALQGALCFLFPSRTEGFGLPAVEAMTLGCPVVASPTPALTDVCGDAALFADPDDVDAWVAAVQSLANDGARRDGLRARGFARAAAFTWRRAALDYLGLMAASDIRHGALGGPEALPAPGDVGVAGVGAPAPPRRSEPQAAAPTARLPRFGLGSERSRRPSPLGASPS